MTQDNYIDTVEVKKEYYESGALWVETPYVKGKRYGIERGYYESGALKFETPYVNDKEHGIDTWYFESGALEREIPYVDGKEHGIVKIYEEGKSNIDCLVLYEKGHEVAAVKI